MNRLMNRPMNFSTRRWLALADVTLFPAFVLWFIWQGQFVARWTWIFFAVWLAGSFVLQRDTPKTLGWRADNLPSATKQAVIVFAVMAAGLIAIGLLLHAPTHIPAPLISWKRLAGYAAFCLLQQVALNSLIHNRMMTLVRNEWVSACMTGLIFAACHWPNPVLVPLTFVGGAVVAWMFGRVRNIIPLAVGQALVSTLASWAFPMAWHHHFRVGPGYYF
jgi:hypothetical protein